MSLIEKLTDKVAESIAKKVMQRTQQENHPQPQEAVNHQGVEAPNRSIHELVELSLDSLQCTYRREDKDGGAIYYFEYQGWNWHVALVSNVMCRLALPTCLYFPKEDYPLAMELSRDACWQFNMIKAGSYLVDDEDDGKIVTVWLYSDMGVNEVRSFVELFKNMISYIFHCRQELNDLYHHTKYEHRLESIDISGITKAENKR